MKIRIIDSGKGAASAHMDKDKSLLEELKDNEVILHLYEWENPLAMTYGYFIQPEKFLILDYASSGLDISRRPTGGGLVFHNGDFAFSLLMSSSCRGFSSDVLENYHKVNSLVLKVLHKVFHMSGVLADKEDPSQKSISENFCMAKTSKYDVLLGLRKIGGAAQRKVSRGFLHQGSVFLSGSTKDFYRKFLLPEVLHEVLEEIEKHAFFPLGIEASLEKLNVARENMKEAFIQIICNEGL